MKTGNVKHVAAFGKLVGICNDLGASYNPSKAALTPTALATLLEQAQQNLEAVNVARANLVLAINARQESYAGVYKLASRVVRAVASTESSRENIRDARLLRQQLMSKHAAKKIAASGEPSKILVSNSSSRLDYDGQADTFSRIINLVQGMTSYAPNEPDLKLVALKAVLSDLKMKSLTVANAANTLVNARISRNKVLLGKEGMYETGTAVKEYIRSVFGMHSEPAKELGKLRLAA